MRHSGSITAKLRQMTEGEMDRASFYEAIRPLNINQLRELGRELLKARSAEGAVIEMVRAEILARQTLGETTVRTAMKSCTRRSGEAGTPLVYSAR